MGQMKKRHREAASSVATARTLARARAAAPQGSGRRTSLLLTHLLATSALAEADLSGLTLEQLGTIQVRSMRRAERLSDTAASIYVIRAEDIRRSAATSLPDALRLAKNLDVARADANQYAITARGFSSVLANKLLVMIDGRTVYSPLFSGVLLAGYPAR